MPTLPKTLARSLLLLLAPALLAVPARAGSSGAEAGCVGSKLRASAAQCQAVLQAWARFERDGRSGRLERSLARAARRTQRSWWLANRRGARRGVDCRDMSLAGDDMAQLIEDRAGHLVEDLSGAGKCSDRFLRAAATACRSYLDAEARITRDVPGDEADELRERLRERAERALERRLAHPHCQAPLAAGDVAQAIANLTRDVVTATTISPDWTTIFPADRVEYNGRVLEPICSGGTPYVFHARSGTENKLIVYYEGGGACWDNFTCGGEPQLGIGPTFKQTAEPDEGPGSFPGSGFADLSNPDNPFRNWNMVYVPYCTGDVHWGDASVDHLSGNRIPVHIEHKGFVNAQVVEKWTREHFAAPEQVFVTGSSAGAYGAIVNSLSLMEYAYPQAEFAVLGDAGNGVITRDFLENDISKWGVEQNLPDWIPALHVPITELDAADLYVAAAQFYPQHRFATYTTAYDGGTGGQTGFFNIMRNIDSIPRWFNWWEASCDWNREMLALNRDAAERTDNFRFYVGTGSAHTMWGRDKVYTDTSGGVPPIVDWIRAMLDDSPAWVNVECSDCGVLLPGDPRPEPPRPPFSEDGRIVCP